MSFNDLDTFRIWLNPLAAGNFTVQFDSADSALFAVEINGVLQGFSFRLFPSTRDVIMRLWSGRCYSIAHDEFAHFIREVPRVNPLFLRTTHYKLEAGVVSQYGFSPCKEFYLTQATGSEQLDDVEFATTGYLSVTEVVQVYAYAIVASDRKFFEVIYSGEKARFIECDDGSVQFFCDSGAVHPRYLLQKRQFSVFDAFGNRMHV